MTLHFNILTLFPEMFPGSLGHSLSGKALESGAWDFTCVNIRDFAEGVHKSVDDTPYGGGAGMVMRADVVEKALLSVSSMSSPRQAQACSNSGDPENDSSTAADLMDPVRANASYEACQRDDGVLKARPIYLSPRGKPLTQAKVIELSQQPEITLLCGRYEGVDQRVLDAYDFEEISIGDYVLSGGEPAALILMDACIRLLPGVMGNTETAPEESFSPSRGGLLEYPHYTKPAEWSAANGEVYGVPEVLRSGNHAKIDEWRAEQSLDITKKVRPELLTK